MVDTPLSNALPRLDGPSRPRGAGLLRLIGVFKLFKGVFLIAGAISVFNLIHKNIAEVIIRWRDRLHLAPGNHLIEHLLERVLTIDKRQLVVAGIVLLIYATMFLIEGVGLLLLMHWAEWMTVITTSGLIPIEIFEMIRRPSWLKALAMAVNIGIAIYLFEHVRREAAEGHRRREINSI
jgi:uncharacterized membrane protein (DUF2068 family)